MTFENLSLAARFAQAAYSTLPQGAISEQLVQALVDGAAGFTNTQATNFAATQTVLLQYNDDVVGSGGNGTSLSLTVFRSSDGQLTLAVRGTLELGDFFPTDANIFDMGAGYDQIAALYNWWMRASTAGSGPVAQYRMSVVDKLELAGNPNVLRLYDLPEQTNQVVVLERIADANSTGELVNALAADSDHKLDVTGHSLGGHLAMAFAGLFPSAAATVTTFNAPGFTDSPINQQFFERLGGVVPTQGSIGAKTINVVADHAGSGDVSWQGIAMLHSRPGTAIDVPIEEQFLAGGEPAKPAAHNHSQMVLADALAVHAWLEKLTGPIAIPAFGSLFESAAHMEHAGLERLVGSIAQLLGVRGSPLPNGHNQREALYSAMNDVLGMVAARSLNGQLIVELATSATGSNARLDFGAFLALHTVSPFMLKGKDAAAQSSLNVAWQQVVSGLYLGWASDKSATLQGDTEHEYTYTDQWIADRALLLSKVTERNIANTSGPLDRINGRNVQLSDADSATTINAGAISGGGNFDVIAFGKAGDDVAGELSGVGGNDRLYGMAGDDVVIGYSGHDHLEGNAGNDQLDGGAGNDTLLGGVGNDQLAGGANDDLLKGGAGSDTYLFDGSAGQDTIIDADGGVIRYLAHVLTGGRETSPGAQEWQDDHATYRLITEGSAQHLRITVGAGTVTIRDWTPGHFGITLQGHQAPAPVTPQQLIVGDLSPVDHDGEAEGVQIERDALGNVIVSNNPSPGRADVLRDSAGNDELRGHGGDDSLNANRGGDDLLDGGAGSDVLQGGEGDDTLIGGEGLDRLLSQGGNDRLYAEAIQSDLQVAADHTEATEDANNGAGQGEALTSGRENDWVVGGRRADALFGGEGKDTAAAHTPRRYGQCRYAMKRTGVRRSAAHHLYL